MTLSFAPLSLSHYLATQGAVRGINSRVAITFTSLRYRQKIGVTPFTITRGNVINFTEHIEITHLIKTINCALHSENESKCPKPSLQMIIVLPDLKKKPALLYNKNIFYKYSLQLQLLKSVFNEIICAT